jgi:Xaa-Pro dipeptidase
MLPVHLRDPMVRIHDTDNDSQRRYFFYLSGCPLPDCYLTYDMAADQLTLYIPPVDPEDVIWSGLPLSPDEALKRSVNHIEFGYG